MKKISEINSLDVKRIFCNFTLYFIFLINFKINHQNKAENATI